MNTPFDFERPLWQMHLVENYGGTGCALIVRFHHCIADGIALIHVMMSMADESFGVGDPSAAQDVGRPGRLRRDGPQASRVVHSELRDLRRRMPS